MTPDIKYHFMRLKMKLSDKLMDDVNFSISLLNLIIKCFMETLFHLILSTIFFKNAGTDIWHLEGACLDLWNWMFLCSEFGVSTYTLELREDFGEETWLSINPQHWSTKHENYPTDWFGFMILVMNFGNEKVDLTKDLFHIVG